MVRLAFAFTSALLMLSPSFGSSMLHMTQKHSLRNPSPTASIMRALFSGTDAAVLMKPKTVNTTNIIYKNQEYIGRVVPTHKQSILVRIDENTNTTDVFMGALKNTDWIIWQVYWGYASTRSTESKIVVFVDMVQWLENYNITLRGDFNNISDWKAWHEACFMIRDK